MPIPDIAVRGAASRATLLRIYCNDHLAGAAGGLALARRCRDSNRGTSVGADLIWVADELAEDRASLLAIMRDLQIPPDLVKQAGVAVLERVGRLKLNGQLSGYSDLSRLLELEALAVGIAAKRDLWVSLQQLCEALPALTGHDLDGLVQRATRQRETVEGHRVEAARIALRPVSSS